MKKGLTLLLAQWVEMEALENRITRPYHAFYSPDAVWQISSLESASSTDMRSVRDFLSFYAYPLSH